LSPASAELAIRCEHVRAEVGSARVLDSADDSPQPLPDTHPGTGDHCVRPSTVAPFGVATAPRASGSGMKAPAAWAKSAIFLIRISGAGHLPIIAIAVAGRNDRGVKG
jgi:hypothetical protein